MKDDLFDKLWRLIEKRAKIILVIMALLSVFFLSFVPSLSFKTDIRGFVPNNEMSKANQRVIDNFGETPRIHFILVKATNPSENVLTPSSLKEQYRVIQEISKIEGVDQTLSAADVVNILCKYEVDLVGGGAEYDETQGLDTADYDQIQARLDLLFDVLNGKYTELLNSMDLGITMFTNNSIDKVKGLIGLIFSEDFSLEDPHAHSTLIIINMNGSLENEELKDLTREIYSTAEDMESDLVNIKMSHTGEYQISTEVDVATRESMGVIVAAILLVIGTMLFISFRRISYVILPLVILLLATVWTYSTAYILGLKFSAMMAGVIPLIFGLGVDYPVHVSERYQEELAKGKDVSNSLRISLKHVGGAITICAISTAIGFFTNVVSDVGAVKVFGISCAIGTAYAFILTLFIYFPTRLLIDRKNNQPLLPNKLKKIEKEKSSAKTRKGKKSYPFISKIPYRFPILVVIAAIIITSASAVGAINLESKFDIKDFLPPEWESIQTEGDIFRDFEAGSYTLSFILIEGDDLATRESYENIYLTLENMKDDKNVVKTTIPNSSSEGGQTGDSELLLTESVPQLAALVYGIDPQVLKDANINTDGSLKPNCTDQDIKEYYDFLFTNETLTDPITDTSLSEHAATILHRNENGEYDATIIKIFVNARSSKECISLYEELKDDIPIGADDDYSVTGGMILNVATLLSLQEGQVKGTLICIAVIALILIFVYRRIGLGIITLIPVIMSLIWILGAMFALGMDINVLTVTVTSLGIGMGIDYAVHVSERFKRELKSYGMKKGIQETIGNLWRPLSVSSMTTVAGFCVLVLIPIPIMAQYGILCALSLVFSYTAAMFILPVALVYWAKWENRGKPEKGTRSGSKKDRIKKSEIGTVIHRRRNPDVKDIPDTTVTGHKVRKK